MSAANPNFLALLAYRSLILVVGLLLAWMGYQLFLRGLVQSSGNLEVRGGKNVTVKLSKAAPGIFFALLGAVIIVYSITRIIQLSETVSPALPAVPAIDTAAPAGAVGGTTQPPGTTTTTCDTCPAPLRPQGAGKTTFLCDTCSP